MNRFVKILILLLISLCCSFGLKAQSRLIPNDPPNNVYSITFTDPAQKKLDVHFDDFITNEGTTAGWTVTVGGINVALAANPTRSGQDLTITLPDTISYEDREDVFVTYEAASGSVALFSGSEPDFTNVQAYNNYIATSDDFSNGLYGEIPPKDVCAPVEDVVVEFNLSISRRFRNSIHFDSPQASIRWNYPENNPIDRPHFVETSEGSALFSITESFSSYPDNTDNCTWVIGIFPFIYGAPTLQPNLLVTQNTIFITIPNYKKDNGTPSPGTGSLAINPPSDDPSTLFCVGSDIEDFIFTEQIEFDCRYDVEPDLPNINRRWVKFVYGSHAGAGIPNVFIQVGDSSVQVTDSNGNGIIRRWYVNPDGTHNPSGYFTSSGYFEGPLELYEFEDEEPFGLINARIQTYPISHAGDFDTDTVDDVFEVTLQAWGPCNSNSLGESPIEITSHLRLIESPPPPTVPDLEDCFGSVTPTLTATGTGGTIDWYSSIDPENIVHTGSSFTHGETAVGEYLWWATETKDPGAGILCRSDTSRATLKIDPIPNKPTITPSGPTDFCFDGSSDVTLTADPQGSTIDSYIWHKDGNPMAGETSNSITLDAVSESGTYTVRTIGPATTSCESPLSDPVDVNIYALATTTDPVNDVTCEAGNLTSGDASFSITAGGAAHTIQWQRSTDGSTWTDITAGTTPNDGCTYSGYTTDELSISGAPYSMNGYEYRAVLTTTAGNCPTISASAVLTVNPLPDLDTPPADDVTCELDASSFNLAASIPAGSISSYQWERNGVSIDGTTDGGAYTGFNTATLDIASASMSLNGNDYSVVITSNNGCAVESPSAQLTVNPLADITTQPADAEICANDNTSFSVATDGNPAVTNYRWQVSSDNGSSWSDVSGGVYSNENTETLNLTGTPLSFNENQYKCILTTAGGCTIESAIAVLTVNQNPAAAINPGSPSALCNGETISFDGNASTGTAPYTHSWGGDNTPLDDPSIETPVFTAPVLLTQNTYNLTYTVTDANNCTATDNVSVVVNPKVNVNVTQSANEVCVGETVNLNGNPSEGTLNYSHNWTGTGAGELNDVSIVNPVFTAPAVLSQTTFTLTYTVTDAEGCQESQSIDIIVNPLPTTNITPAAPGALCFNETLSLDGNAADGTPDYTHSWSGDVGPLNSTTSETPVFTAPSVSSVSNYNLSYTLEDSNGCIATDNVTVTVNPEVETAVLSGDASICSGASSNLQVTISGGIGPYTVVLNDGTNNITINDYDSGDLIPTGALTTTTTYTLVSVTDANSCPASALNGTATITVGASLVDARLQGATEICFGQTTPLQVIINGGAPPYEINIDAFGSNITNYQSGDDIPTGMLAVGAYPYNLVTVEDACGNTIGSPEVDGGNPQQIVVRGLPDITGTTNNAEVICNDGFTDITLVSDVDTTQFSWTVDDGGGVTWVGGKSPSSGSMTDGAGTEKITQNLQHSMNTPVSVDYIITSQGPGTAACPGNSVTRTVIVEPTIEVTASNDTICHNTSTNIDVETLFSGNYGQEYTWTVSADPGISGASDNISGTVFDQNITQTLENSGSSPAKVTYTIQGHTLDNLGNLNCAGPSINVEVVVEPEVQITASDTVVCSNQTFNLDVNTTFSGIHGEKYNWTVSAPAEVTGATNGPAGGVDFGTDITDALENTSGSPKVVTYTITGYTTGADGNLECAGPSKDVLVTVEPIVEVTASDKTICFDSPVNLDVNTAYSGTEGVKYSWTVVAPVEITGENNGPLAGVDFSTDITHSLQNSATTAKTATYTLTGYTTLSGSLECPGTPLDVDVIVEPQILVTASDTTICNNTSTNLNVNTLYSGSQGTRYNWTVSAPAGITGASDGPSGGRDFSTNLSQTLENTTDDPIVVTYTITGYTLDGTTLVCGGPSINVDVTVEPNVDVTASDTTICEGQSPVIDVNTLNSGSNGVKYTWTVAAPDEITGESNGPANGQTFAQDIDHALGNTGTSPHTAIYTITGYTTDGSGNLACAGTPLDVNVTVEPEVQVTASDKTICNNSPANLDVNTIYSGTHGVRYNYTVSAPAEISGASDGIPEGYAFTENIGHTLTNSSNSPKTATYTITGYTVDGSGNLDCAGPPITVDVIVEPDIAITASDKTICSNESVDIDVNTTYSGSVGMKYTWTVSAPDSVTGATNGPPLGQDFDTNIDHALVNTSTTEQVVSYTITGYTVNGSGDLECASPPITVDVTVEPVVEVMANGETICYDGSTNIDVNTIYSASEGVKYSWVVTAPADITGENDGPVLGEDFANNIVENLRNSATTAKTAVYTITGYTTNSSGNLECAGTPLDVDVIVEPEVQITASDKTICSNTSTDLDVNTLYSGSLGTKYSWTVNAPAGINNASDDAGNGLTFDTNLSQNLVNTTETPLTVTYTIRGYTTNGSGDLICPGPSIEVDITVEPEVEVTASDQRICEGNSPNIDVNTLSSGTNGVKYTWTVTDLDSITGETDGPSNGLTFAQNIDHVLQSTATSPKTLTYTITGFTTDGSGNPSCMGTALDVDVIVEPEVKVTASDKTICNNTSVDLDVNTIYSGTDGVRYTWTASAPGSISGATNNTDPGKPFSENIEDVLVNSSTSPLEVTYTITGHTIDGSGNLECAGPSINVDVTVEPDVIVTAANEEVCFGEFTGIDVNTANSSPNGVEYNWTVSAPGTVTGAIDGPGGGVDFSTDISQQLENSSTSPENVVYTITGYTLDEFGDPLCYGTPLDVTVIANPKPDVSYTNHKPAIPTHDYTDIELDSNVPGTTFGWRVLNPGSSGATNGSGLAIGESIEQQLFNLGATPVTITYRIGPSFSACPGDSVDVDVQIDPNVDMSLDNLKPDICTGENTQINLSSTVTGATFSWKIVDPDGAGAIEDTIVGPNTGVSIQQNLINNGTTPITVEYQVTPTGPAPTYIVGSTQNTTVTVYPEPEALPINKAPRICNGTRSNILMDSDVTGTTFTWTVIDPTGGASGASASGSPVAIGDSISQQLTNAGDTPITITYVITPTGPMPTNCAGDPVSIDVIVDPTPVANINNTAQAICSETSTAITLNSSVPNSTFEYFVADPKGTGATDGTGNTGDVIAQNLTNTTQTPVQITYEIIPYGPGATSCPGTPVYEDVTINPLPITSEISGVDTVCEGTTGLVYQVDLTSGSHYEWDVPASLGTITFGGTGTNSNAVIITAANGAGTDSMWVYESNQYGCTKDTIYKPLTIIATPAQVDINGPDEVCAQSENVIYDVPNNPGSTYQWFVPAGSGIVSDPTLNQVEINFGLVGGQVRVIETSAGGCVTTHNPKNVAVNPLPLTTLNADKLSICDGDTVTFVAGPTGAGYNYEFFINGVSAQNGASDVYMVDSLENNDQVTVNVTTDKGCEKLSPAIQITVNDLPVVNLTSSDADNIICDNSEVTFQANSGTAVSYNFFLNGASVQFGALNFWSSTNINDGDEVYVEVMSAFGCYETSNSIITTVNPLPVAELTGDNTICPGESTPLNVDITTGTAPYDVTIDNGVGLQNYLASPGITDVSPGMNTTYTLVSVEDDNGCISDELSGNLSGSAAITVRDTVEIITQPHDALVCENTDTSFTVSAQGEGLIYQWEYTDDLANPFAPVDAGLVGHADFDQATMSINAADPMFDGYYYRVLVSSAFCPEADYSDTVQLFMRYDPVSARDPYNQLICEGDATGFGVDAGITENPVFQWQISYDNGTSFLDLGDTAIYSGTTTDSLRIGATASRFDGYQYRVIISGDCGLPIESAPAVLSIDERPEIIEQPEDTTVCENNPVQFNVNAGVTTNAAYQWQVDMGSGFQDIPEDTLGVYTGHDQPQLTVDNATSRFNGYSYRVVVSGDCPAPVTSTPAVLTVNEDPEITLQPRDTVICENESPYFSVNAGVTSAAAYQWQVSSDNGSSWQDLADTAIYTGSFTSMLRLLSVPSSYDQNQYRVIISGACTPAATSNEVLLTVRERPEILEQPEDTTVCEEEPLSFSVNAGVTTGVMYQWQVDMNTGSFVDIGADTGIYNGFNQATLNLSAPTSAYNGYRYRVIVSGDCNPSQTSANATLNIWEKAEITVQPIPKEICEESNTFFNISSGATTSPAYEWQVDMGSGFTTIGADTGVYTGTLSNTLLLNDVPSSYNGFTYRAIVSGVCPETATSDEVGLIVNQKPEIIDQPVNDTVCENDPAIFTVDAGVTTNVEYTWYVNESGLWQEITLADQSSGEYSGVETATLTLNSATSAYHGNRYRVIISGKCSPDVTSETVTLVVDERPEIIQQPMDKTICEDSDITFVVNAGATTEPVYFWEYSANGTDWFAADMLAEVADHTDDSLNLVAVPSTYHNYQFRATISGKCATPVLSDEVTLTVYEKPQIDIQPVDEDACEQDTVFFFVDAGVTTNATYTWQYYNGSAWVVPSAGIFEGVNDDTLFINGINSSLNGEQYRVVVGGFCSPSVISDTVELTVYERPEILAQPAASEICENDSTFFGLNAGVTTNATYKWEYFDGSNWQTATGGIFENENSDTLLLNNVPASWDGTPFRGIVYGECEPSDTTLEAILNVRIRPYILTQPSDEVTCENVSVSYSVDADLTYSPSYQWQYHDGTSSGWQNTVGANYSGSNAATLTINNPVSSMNGYAYRVILSGYCGPGVISDSVSLTVEENPEITLQPVNAMICENSDTSFTIDAGVTTNPDYTWYFHDGSSWQPVTADGVHSGFDTNTLELSNVPFSFDNYRYYAEVSGTCGTAVTSERVNLYVLRRAEITQQPSDTASCELNNVSFSIETGKTDGVFIQWQMNDNSSEWEDLFDGGNYTGSNSTELRVYSIDSAMNNYRYRAIVYGTCPDSAISDEATLTVYNAPDIWTDPEDMTVCEGDAASFQIMTTGDNLTYYWQVDMNDGLGFRTFSDTAGVYSGTGSELLTVESLDRSYNNYRYRAMVEGRCNPLKYSGFAVLRINTGPEIIDQPVNDTICEFSNVSFSVNAQGTNLEYIWQENDGNGWSDLSDAGDYIGTTSPTMSIFNLARESSGNRYRVIISGECPSPVDSDEAEIFIKTSPVVTVPPSDTTVCQDEPVEFSVTAEGSDLTYQWQISTGGPYSNLGDDAVYSGTTTGTLQIATAPPAFDNYKYRVLVSGSCAPAANSPEATLRVNTFPPITVQPMPSEICEGGNTSFTGGATGAELAFQWEFNDGSGWAPVPEDTVYSGTTTTSLSITNAPVSLNGNRYRLSVSSTCKNAMTDEVLLTVNENPTATITGDGSFPFVCGGFDINLDGNPAGGTGSYVKHVWTGDIAALSNNSQPQTVFSTVIDNMYDLTYTVTDDKGCKGSDNVTIENNIPNAQFVSDAYPACGSLEVNFENKSTGATSYEWDFDDGSPVENTVDPVHSFDNLEPSGLVKYYNVQLVAESAKGCSDTATQFVTIYPKVDPTFEVTPDTACQPVVATLVTQPGAANYTWDYGDGQQENGSYTMMHEFTNTTDQIQTYEISLTTTSFYGCVETATNEITVYPLPTPNFTVSPIVQTYPDATVEIDNLVRPGPWTYEYDFGDGNTSNEEAPSHTYAESGTYTIIQRVSAGECIDSIGQSVVINPTPPVADFILPESGCTPLQIQFENTSLYANSYVWEFGDGSVSTKKNPIYTYFEPGTYAVTLTVNGPGGSDTYKQNLEIWATPNLFFNNAPDSVYVGDKPVKFFNYSSDASNYSWNFGDYDENTDMESELNTSEDFEPSHVYEFEGWKDVLLIGWNDNCSDTVLKEQAVYVSPAGTFRFPNVFRPNPHGPNGGVIDNLAPSEVNSVFFPGVADQVLEYNLYIYNRWGELIFESDNINRGWDGYINGRLARQGVYVWKVKGTYTNGKNFVEVGDVTLLH